MKEHKFLKIPTSAKLSEHVILQNYRNLEIVRLKFSVFFSQRMEL